MDHAMDAKRLEQLYCADHGFFSLATHAWIESWIQKQIPGVRESSRKPDGSDAVRFVDYLNAIRERGRLDQDWAGRWAGAESLLSTIEAFHRETNTVRHGFATLPKQRANDYLALLVAFMQHAGISREIVHRLETLRLENEVDYRGLLQELANLRTEEIRRQNGMAAAESVNPEGMAQELDLLKRELGDREAEIARLQEESNRLGTQAAKVDDLRSTTAEYKNRIRALEERMQRARLREDFFRSMACHSRSRVLLERSLMKLSHDQEEAVLRFHDQEVFLVKGPAGSGKTIVLLKCVARALELAGQGELLDAADSRPLVMNWGKRLQAYSQYQIRVHSLFGEGQVEMKTVDSWLTGLVKKHLRLEVDWPGRLTDQVARMGTIEGLPGVEAELEMIWTRGVLTREAYLEYSRIGMGRGLTAARRHEVWDLHEKLVEQSLAAGKVLPSLGWWLLLRHLTQAGQTARARWARVFVDECQDLTGTKLAILRRQAEHLVLAGDSEQMIYRGTSPFLDAGMDMRRVTTVVLSQVYRNTIPVFEFARRLREMIPDAEDAGPGHATRMGPLPEVCFASGWNGMLDHLVERIRALAFREDSLYEPGSIAVLTLGRPEDYAARLEARNIKVCLAKNDDVDFSRTDAVFVSTIHTAKGMDFPVVFVLLDEIEEQRRFYLDDGADPEACAPRLMRLLYVASTRGMDMLEICCQQTGTGGRLVPELRAINAAHQGMLEMYAGAEA